MTLPILSFAFFFLLKFSPFASAQQDAPVNSNDQPQIILRTTTRAVVLDVVVSDHTGRPVQGLSRPDFSILEDGVPQEIVSFESADFHLHPVSDEQRARTILILDEMNTQFTDLAFARYSVGKLLRRHGGKLDGPTSLMALTNGGLVQLHGYTRDATQLRTALDQHQSSFPWRLQSGIGGLSERMGMSVGAIEEIALATSDSQARKNIVWISPGFPVLERAEASSEARARLFDGIRKLSDDLLRARITMYTVDPRGVPLGGSVLDTNAISYFHGYQPGATTTIADLALERLAFETGGKALRGRNDVDAEIERTMVEGATYFTLSYYPSNHDWNGAFRKLKVRVDKPGLRARTRDGYFGVPEPAPPSRQEVALQLTEAVSSGLSFTAVPVSVTYARQQAGNTAGKLEVSVDAAKLSWKPSTSGDYHCTVDVVVASLSAKGQRLDYIVQAVGGSIPAARFQTAGSKSWVIPLQVQFNPQAARTRVVVRDKTTGKMGTADFSQAAIGTSPL